MLTRLKLRSEFPAAETAVIAPAEPRKPQRQENPGTRLLLLAAAVMALWFLNTSALRYFRLDPDSYGIFWPRRHWLAVHVITGTLAVLLGPVQMWLGLNKRHPMLHRVLGVGYVASVAASVSAAFYLAFHTDFGWMFALGITSMAVAWTISTGLATIAICRRLVEHHREWMVRSYVVTFGFVTFRLVADTLGMLGVGTFSEQLTVASWFCWSVPLLITETILQGRKIFASKEDLVHQNPANGD